MINLSMHAWICNEGVQEHDLLPTRLVVRAIRIVAVPCHFRAPLEVSRANLEVAGLLFH